MPPLIVIRQTFKKSIKLPGIHSSIGKRLALPTTQYLIGQAEELDSLLAKVKSEKAQITCIPSIFVTKNLLSSADAVIKYLTKNPKIRWKNLKEIIKKREDENVE